MSEYNATVFMEQGGDRQINENVTRTTAASTGIANYGVTILAATQAATFNMDAPDRKGISKRIISLSSFVFKIRTNPAGVNRSTYRQVQVTNSSKYKWKGTAIDMVSYSTVLWYATVIAPSSAGQGIVMSTNA